VVAAVETLPLELRGLASVVRVNLPWGGLLRGLLRPEPMVLRALAGLTTADGRFEVVLSYDPGHDNAVLGGDALPPLDERYVADVLVPGYGAAGLAVETWRQLSRDEALAIPSTWGRRLLHGRPRDVFLLEGSFVADA